MFLQMLVQSVSSLQGGCWAEQEEAERGASVSVPWLGSSRSGHSCPLLPCEPMVFYACTGVCGGADAVVKEQAEEGLCAVVWHSISLAGTAEVTVPEDGEAGGACSVTGEQN